MQNCMCFKCATGARCATSRGTSSYQQVTRTAIQRAMEIARYKQQKEVKIGKMSNAKIAELYRANLVLAEGSEDISEKYVSIALRVHEHLLSVPAVKTAIMKLEEQLGQASPFNSIYRYGHALTRTRFFHDSSVEGLWMSSAQKPNPASTLLPPSNHVGGRWWY